MPAPSAANGSQSEKRKQNQVIAAKIAAPGCLNREQKHVVRTVVKDQFMREVWADSQAVLDYLGNTDYHSPGVG